MKAIAEIVILLIGVTVWYLLKPYIGFGGFLVGAVVAYVSRPIVHALLGVSVSAAKTQSRNETEAQQGESTPSSHNETNQQLALPFAEGTISGESTPSRLFSKPQVDAIDLGKSLQEAFRLGEATDPASRAKAISLYQKILRESPDCFIAWFNLGVIQSRTGKWQTAIQSFRQAQKSPDLRTVAAFARLKVLVGNGQEFSATDFPEEFREGESLTVLGIQGPCHNAVNELRKRGYTSTVEGEGKSCSIVSLVGSAKYTITLNDMFGGLIRNVYREEDGCSFNLGDLKTLSELDKEFLNLQVGRLDLVQATIPLESTGADDLMLRQTAPITSRPHDWVRQGRSFEEILAQRKVEAKQRGVDLVQHVSTEEIARDNWVPGIVFVYVLDGEPNAIAMLHEIQPGTLPVIKTSVAEGACLLRGEFFSMTDYPLIHIGLGIPVRFTDKTRFDVSILESVVNFAEANFQDWIVAVEAKKHMLLHAFGPDRSHIASGRMNLAPEVVSGIVDAVNQASSTFKQNPQTAADFSRAMSAFFEQHPKPFIWSP